MLKEGMETLVGLKSVLQDNVSKARANLDSIKKQLPTLLAENRATFMEAMSRNKTDDSILNAADSLSTALHESAALARTLELPELLLVPCHAEGAVDLRYALTMVCVSTSERILASAAAKNFLPDAMARAHLGSTYDYDTICVVLLK